ncbi:unnamed protein product [Prorocentrum cordatum]|uniref:Uncharacterized protein n=1 Tax=Prorocentrum cordatum TaxID=2364126 RepID=A0ABN9U7B4_9DINO|nr:unnamed protein product [Polarella glacialis]
MAAVSSKQQQQQQQGQPLIVADGVANLLDAAAVAAFLAYGRERALSLAADAKHGAQVARVRLGVDATVRKVLGHPPRGQRRGGGGSED